MDHRNVTNSAALTAAALALLLGFLLPVRVWAQDETSPPPAGDGGQVIRHTRPPKAKAAAAKAEVSVRERAADDPEARPVAALELPRETPPADDPGALALSVLGKTGLVVALMLACAAGWKRLRGTAPLGRLAPAQAVQITSTVSLGPQRFLHLVTVGRHQLLVGSSPQNVSLVAVLEDGTPRAAEPEPAPGAPSWSSDPRTHAPEAPADRFEDLLIRLRELETGPLASTMRESSQHPPSMEASFPGDSFQGQSGTGPMRREDRGLGLGRGLEAGWMGRAGGESPPPAAAAESPRTLTPGSLFRTAPAGHSGSHPPRDAIDA